MFKMLKTYSSLSFLIMLFSAVNVVASPVCLRSLAVRSAIEVKLNKHCEQIAAADLAQIQSLSLASYEINNLKGDDLQGLTNLET